MAQNPASKQLPPPAAGGVVLVVAVRAGLGDQADNANTDAVRAELDQLPGGRVLVGGYPVIDRELGATAESDLVDAEGIALPIVLILLGLALRTVFGTLLGLALVATTVTGALAILLALSTVADVSSFAINVVTMFGMGLAVDYGLLLLTRFRRERAAGIDVRTAVAVTMATAGRTVAFSGLTVAVALAGLLVFSEPIMRSMAYGGIGAVGVAVASALTLLPVLLRRVGHRIPPAPQPPARGGFTALARLVQHRPVLVTAAALATLTLLALPLGGLHLEGLDARALPGDSTARIHTRQLEQQLPTLARTPITIAATITPTDARLAGYLDQLRRLDHVATATPRTGTTGGLTIVDVTVDGPPAGRDAMNLVDTLRGIEPGFDTKVGGLAARDRDFITSLLRRSPYAAVLIAVLTFLVLLTVTGGVLVAAKAVAMNVASLAASLGALVWIFQDGHLAAPLGVTPTGGLELIIVVLAAVFAFGLSTDYEVFLLSAVMAARHDGADTDTAVAAGIQRTGRTITTAAVLLIVVFTGFAAGDLLIIKQLGIGLAIAVGIDATLVRLALTPALMTLLRERNWTGPHWATRTSHALWHHEQRHTATPSAAPSAAPTG
ncbi:MAG: MMPL family transporter [Actinobacteria bacterium]|nr:MMPL family transporter [Actinomycetota bacterium]